LLYHLTEKGEKVKAIYRQSSSISEVEKLFRFYTEDADRLVERIQWIEAELSDYFALEDALRGVKHVYHVAAMVSFNPRESDKMLEVNTQGTANLMNACLKCEIKKVCYVSSTSSLGKSVDGVLVDEQVEWQPD